MPASASESARVARSGTPARTRRQVTHGELDHIALVPDPAYVGANVLAVRSY